jgi:hypothetical protein
MVDLSKYKKSSKDSMERLAAQMEKLDNPQKKEYAKDDTYWTPTADKAGNAIAVIRFLPAPPVDGDDGLDIVQYFSHGFQGPTGKWYIEKSLTTLEKKDPVGEMNRRLWATNEERYQKIVSAWKRKLNYVSNILVVDDPAKPENNGKVFRYRYGKKIYDKAKLMMFPLIKTKKKINPFHVMEGCNFNLVQVRVSGYPNYDQSEFDSPSPIAETDEEIVRILEACHSLKSVVDPATAYKDYDTLKRELDEAIGVDTSSDDIFTAVLKVPTPKEDSAKPKSNTSKFSKQEEVNTPPWDETESDDEDAEFFRKMAAGA